MGKEKITSWEKMKKELRKKFLPENCFNECYLKMYNFRQGNRSVDEYTEEFDLLTMRCGLNEPEEQTMARYHGGFRQGIHDGVTLQPYWTYNNLYKLAINFEKQTKQRPFQTLSNTGCRRGDQTGETNRSKANNNQSKQPTRESDNYMKRRQEAYESTSSKPTTLGDKPIKCFKCQGYGHVSSNCPNRKYINLVEDVEREMEMAEPPCLMGFATGGRTFFLRMHAGDFRNDLHGVFTGLRDRGYSDCSNSWQYGNIRVLSLHHQMPSFPTSLQVASDLTFPRIAMYWNY
ncbi:hypothetical protein HHK36_014245 [Tetracentron sinense]|uniref:CCHC-type domain-containing protein n=1 Tax=Tetracentron sinense TaxID=13715 RepID=A0A834ZEI4_TETSI|nr:hypothetical protein HHK36_014245 [Tetracentron sinense]